MKIHGSQFSLDLPFSHQSVCRLLRYSVHPNFEHGLPGFSEKTKALEKILSSLTYSLTNQIMYRHVRIASINQQMTDL